MGSSVGQEPTDEVLNLGSGNRDEKGETKIRNVQGVNFNRSL